MIATFPEVVLPNPSNILTSAQCRAARAMIEWSAEHLAQVASVDLQKVMDFEARFLSPDDETRRCIRIALEKAGITFIAENGAGAGVRLKFDRKEVKAIRRWEAEGGASGADALC